MSIDANQVDESIEEESPEFHRQRTVVVQQQLFQNQVLDGAERKTDYIECRFANVKWIGTLRHVRFIRCTFGVALWENADLFAVEWSDCELEQVNWKNSQLRRLQFIESRVTHARMDGCTVSFPVICHSNWSTWHLERTSLLQLVSTNSQFIDVHASHTSMTDVTWAKCLQRGWTVKDTRMERYISGQTELDHCRFERCEGQLNRWIDCDMHRIDYRQCTLDSPSWIRSRWKEGSFTDSELNIPVFCEAALEQVEWTKTSCDGAMFDKARLHDCDLSASAMRGVSFRGAHLSTVDLSDVQAAGADVSGAQLRDVDLRDADFSRSKMLGQSRERWADAGVAGSTFDVDPAFDDTSWWAAQRPGPRPVGERSQASRQDVLP